MFPFINSCRGITRHFRILSNSMFIFEEFADLEISFVDFGLELGDFFVELLFL